jgi:serine/threonine protein kinase
MDDEWIIQIDEINIMYDQILGSGQYGIVYKGIWRGIFVAVKQFVLLDSKKIKLMQNEFRAMTKLHHPNIIQLLGYIENPFMIIMEYMENGSLSNYIHHHTPSIMKKINFMIEIAQGLTYLHQRRPSYVIHRDIKPTNFLINKDLHVKIADFGICKILDSSKSLIHKSHESMTNLEIIQGTANVGTMFYMAPELIHSTSNNSLYSSNVDIYSFGSVMYEVFEGYKLFEFSKDKNEFLYYILTHHIPHFGKTPFFLKTIILQCLDHDPMKRPNALSLVTLLKDVKDKYWFYRYICIA